VRNAEWQQYLVGLEAAPERAAWTHAVHLRRLHVQAGPRPAVTVGCFSYELVGADRARLHFHLSSLRSVEHPYQRMPLWGQFLTRGRTVRPEAGSRLLTNIARASSVSDLARCFPLSVLATTAPARWFYDHTGLVKDHMWWETQSCDDGTSGAAPRSW